MFAFEHRVKLMTVKPIVFNDVIDAFASAVVLPTPSALHLACRHDVLRNFRLTTIRRRDGGREHNRAFCDEGRGARYDFLCANILHPILNYRVQVASMIPPPKRCVDFGRPEISGDR